MDDDDKDAGVVAVGTIVEPGVDKGGDIDMGGVCDCNGEVAIVVVAAAAVCDRNEDVVKVG